MAYGDDPFGVRDAKMRVVTADTGTSGPTYSATNIDIRGVTEIGFEPEEGDQVDAEGDDEILASETTAGAIRGTIRTTGIPYTAYAAIYNLTVAVTGTTPSEITSYTKPEVPNRPFFGLHGMSLAKGGGAVLVDMKKVKADGELPPFALTNGEFGTTEIPFTAYKTDSTTGGQRQDIVIARHETAPASAWV